jgi:hypothetical protein
MEEKIMSIVERRCELPPEINYRPKMVRLGEVEVSRFILGGNPFSGFSHQTKARDEEMCDWYTMDRMLETYALAEAAGCTAHLGRIDEFISRALREHWNRGGGLTWIAQTCPHVTTLDRAIAAAIRGKAKCVFIHGGEMDFLVAAGDTEAVFEGVARIKDAGLAVGVAGHRTDTIRWAAEHLDLDFFMTCYYNPDDRRVQPSRDEEVEEYYGEEHREAMCKLIQQLPAPAIHYKVLAAGRHDPAQAFAYVADAYRPGDAVCVGIHTKDNGAMIQEDINLLESALAQRAK